MEKKVREESGQSVGETTQGEIIGICVQVDLRHKNPEEGADDDWIIDSVNNLEMSPVKQRIFFPHQKIW